MRTAAELGGDAGVAARNAVEGAIRGAKDLCVDAVEVGAAAGSEARREVSRALTGAIAGVAVR